ncbi:MAG: hypothetical protein ACO3FE_14650, partial [Planctomycetaceae bacterium]
MIVGKTWQRSFTHVPDLLFFRISRQEYGHYGKKSQDDFHFPLRHTIDETEIELYAVLCHEGDTFDRGHWRMWFREPSLKKWVSYNKKMEACQSNWISQKNVRTGVSVLIYRRTAAWPKRTHHVCSAANDSIDSWTTFGKANMAMTREIHFIQDPDAQKSGYPFRSSIPFSAIALYHKILGVQMPLQSYMEPSIDAQIRQRVVLAIQNQDVHFLGMISTSDKYKNITDQCRLQLDKLKIDWDFNVKCTIDLLADVVPLLQSLASEHDSFVVSHETTEKIVTMISGSPSDLQLREGWKNTFTDDDLDELQKKTTVYFLCVAQFPASKIFSEGQHVFSLQMSLKDLICPTGYTINITLVDSNLTRGSKKFNRKLVGSHVANYLRCAILSKKHSKNIWDGSYSTICSAPAPAPASAPAPAPSRSSTSAKYDGLEKLCGNSFKTISKFMTVFEVFCRLPSVSKALNRLVRASNHDVIAQILRHRSTSLSDSEEQRLSYHCGGSMYGQVRYHQNFSLPVTTIDDVLLRDDVLLDASERERPVRALPFDLVAYYITLLQRESGGNSRRRFLFFASRLEINDMASMGRWFYRGVQWRGRRMQEFSLFLFAICTVAASRHHGQEWALLAIDVVRKTKTLYSCLDVNEEPSQQIKDKCKAISDCVAAET